jgi:hypothetical protein
MTGHTLEGYSEAHDPSAAERLYEFGRSRPICEPLPDARYEPCLTARVSEGRTMRYRGDVYDALIVEECGLIHIGIVETPLTYRGDPIPYENVASRT